MLAQWRCFIIEYFSLLERALSSPEDKYRFNSSSNYPSLPPSHSHWVTPFLSLAHLSRILKQILEMHGNNRQMCSHSFGTVCASVSVCMPGHTETKQTHSIFYLCTGMKCIHSIRSVPASFAALPGHYHQLHHLSMKCVCVCIAAATLKAWDNAICLGDLLLFGQLYSLP